MSISLLWEYLFAVVTNAFGLASAIYAVLELLAVLAGRELPIISRKWRIAIILPLLICAQFWAWKSEHERWDSERLAREESEHEKVKLQTQLDEKENANQHLRDVLAEKPAQVQLPPIQIPPAQVQVVRERPARHLSGMDREQLLNTLRISKSHQIKISSPIGDNEAYEYGLEIMGVLKEAGWSVEDILGRVMHKPPLRKL